MRTSKYILILLCFIWIGKAYAQGEVIYGKTRFITQDTSDDIKDIKDLLQQELTNSAYGEATPTQITFSTENKKESLPDFDMLSSDIGNYIEIKVIRYVGEKGACAISKEDIVPLMVAPLKAYTQDEFSVDLLENGKTFTLNPEDDVIKYLQKTMAFRKLSKPGTTRNKFRLQLDLVTSEKSLALVRASEEKGTLEDANPIYRLRLKASLDKIKIKTTD